MPSGSETPPRALLGPLGSRCSSSSASFAESVNSATVRQQYAMTVIRLIASMGFPGGSEGKESACNAGDSGSIPGPGGSGGEGIGHPLQCSWASLVTQLVKNPPAMRETWVQSLSWEDPLKEGMAAHSSVLAWRIPMDRGPWWAIVHGIAKSRTALSD